MRAVRHCAGELRAKLLEQRGVGAEGCHVVAKVVEYGRRIAVHALQGRAQGRVEVVGSLNLADNAGKAVELGGAGNADGSVGPGVRSVEVEELGAHFRVVGRAEQARRDVGVRHPVAHYLRRAAYDVVGHVAQVVCRLDRRHIAIVEENEFHVHPGGLYPLGQCGDVGLRLGRRPAEEACQRAARSLPVVTEALGKAARAAARDGHPAHAVAADGHGVARRGGGGAHVGEHRGYAGGGGVGRVLVFFYRLVDARGALWHKLVKLGLCGRSAHIYQHSHAVACRGGHGLPHVGDVFVEERRKVGGPGKVHQHRLYRSLRGRARRSGGLFVLA